MRIKKNFVLRKVADVWVVLPLANKTLNFDGMIRLNETGVLLWNRLAEDCEMNDLTKALTETYEVSETQAESDVEAFVEKLRSCGCIEE